MKQVVDSVSRVEKELFEGTNQKTLTALLDKLSGVTQKRSGLGEIVVKFGHSSSAVSLVKQIIDQVDELLGREVGGSRSLIQFVTDRPGHDFRYALDGSRLENDLGWMPSRTLAEGLRETVAWYLDNRAWLEEADDDRFRTYYREQYSGR